MIQDKKITCLLYKYVKIAAKTYLHKIGPLNSLVPNNYMTGKCYVSLIVWSHEALSCD